MEKNSVLTNEKSTIAESSGGLQNEGVARQNRSKATVVLSEGAEKVRLPVDNVLDGQQTARKSGMFPSQRRGSRKQTLSLNPEEREALENLIEEVILDGMGDGVVDSDGSSSDIDDRTDDIFENECCTTGDISVSNSGSKMNSHENASPSSTVAGKKYYPGQLKVALKHMTNLPPRFVRKLAKAQQYLDAASSTDEPVRPAAIVGRIEEEEEVASAAQVKDDSNSPVSGQQDKDKSKLKETKLQEVKKKIRTLLCDREQYVDEKSLNQLMPPANSCGIEAVMTATETTSHQSATAAVNISRIVEKGGTFLKDGAPAVENNSADLSNIVHPRASLLFAVDSVVPSVTHVSKVQTFPVAPSLSATVSNFVPKHCIALPMAYSSSTATGLGTSYNRGSREFMAMSPAQPDNFTRTASSLAGSHDPQYYIQQTPVQGHPTNYYGMPQMYNTPPPTVGISPRIIGEMLPTSATLVQPVSVNGVALNNSGSYSLPSQYSLPAYANVYSSPYLQHQSQTSMYAPSYTSSHSTPPGAYQMPASVAGGYGIVPSGIGVGSSEEFQYSMEQPGPVRFSVGNVSYVSFNGASQGPGLHQHNWVSTSQSPGFAASPRKSHAEQPKWSTAASSVSRPSPSQISRQTVRFAHTPGQPANRMTSSNSGVHSRTVKSSGTVPYCSPYSVSVMGSNWLPSAFPNTVTCERDSIEPVERQPVGVECSPSSGVDISLPALDLNQIAVTPLRHGFSSKQMQTNLKENSRKALQNTVLSNISTTSSSSKVSDVPSDRAVSLCNTTHELKTCQENSSSFDTLCPEHSIYTQSDSQESIVQSMLLPQFKSDLQTPVSIQSDDSDPVALQGVMSDSGVTVQVAFLEKKSNSDVSSPVIMPTANPGVDVEFVTVSAIERIPVHCETSLSTPIDNSAITDQVLIERNTVLHADTPDISVPSCSAQDDAVGNEIEGVHAEEDSTITVIAQSRDEKNETIKPACDNVAQLAVLSLPVSVDSSRTGNDVDSNHQESAISAMNDLLVNKAPEACRVPDISLGSSLNVTDLSKSFESNLQVPESLLVALSSEFLESLLKMFEPHDTRGPNEGATSSSSRQVILNSAVLRQIYISWQESHNDN